MKKTIVAFMVLFSTTGCQIGEALISLEEDVYDVVPDKVEVTNVQDDVSSEISDQKETSPEDADLFDGQDYLGNPPNTVIKARPAAVTNQTNVQFEFDCEEQSCTFMCRLGNGDWEACSSPKEYVELPEGIYTFYAKGTNTAGVEDKTPAAYSWKIDLTKPDTTISLAPPSITDSSVARFEFGCPEGSCLFKCIMDDQEEWEDCTSPKQYLGLGEGNHTFSVKAIDQAGNEDATPAAYAWIIDLTPPSTVIESTPSKLTNSTNATFEFSCSGGETCTFKCKIDDEGWENCSSPKQYAALLAGFHVFSVKAVDAIGREEQNASFYLWVIDLTSSEAFITATPSAVTNSTDATFEFSCGGETCLFKCKIDDQEAWEDCPSPKQYSDLPEGQHTFLVKAIDMAGNEDERIASYSWAIDLALPTATIALKPSILTNSTSAMFAFECSEANCSFECKLDDEDWSGCLVMKVYTGLLGVAHTVLVRATDEAGNHQADTTSYSWTIDLTLPDVVITSKPANLINSTQASFEFSCGETCTFECLLDNIFDIWGGCSSPLTFTGLSEGTHLFKVKAKDAAGNESTATYSWVIDLTAPTTTILSSPPDSDNFTFTSDEEVSSYECRLDTGEWSVCSSPQNYGELTPGSHHFYVRATDLAGNVEAPPTQYSWVYFRAPNISLGDQHSCYHTSDKEILCWGFNGNGQLGDGTTDDKSAMNPILGDDDWSQVASGSTHTCAIKAGQTLWCWGNNMSGQLGIGNTTEQHTPTQVSGSWALVAPGSNHTCAIKADGTLWCWGNNTSGQLGIGSTSVTYSPTQIPGSWAFVAPGDMHTCAIKADGTLWCWGNNISGRLGIGSTVEQHSPAQIPGSWALVDLGAMHTCAIKADGTLWCWGANWSGQLGIGSTVEQHSPTQVPGSWTQVSSGGMNTCAIKADGTSWCWGDNMYGQLGIGNREIQYSPTEVTGNWLEVSSGGQHTCAVKADDNTLWCWGFNNRGQLGIGIGCGGGLQVLPIQTSSTVTCPEIWHSLGTVAVPDQFYYFTAVGTKLYFANPHDWGNQFFKSYDVSAETFQNESLINENLAWCGNPNALVHANGSFFSLQNPGCGVQPSTYYAGLATGWVTLTSYQNSYGGVATTANGNVIWRIGGSGPNAEVHTYSFTPANPTEGLWSTTGQYADHPFPIQQACAVAYNDKIYVFGGSNATGQNVLMTLYDIAENSWTTLPASANFPSSCNRAEGFVWDDKIVVANYLGVDVFDPTNNTWSMVPPPPSGIDNAAAVVPDNGKLYMISWSSSAAAITIWEWISD